MKTIIYLTLIQSLWQGLLLAGLTGLILIFAARASAATRYRLLTGSLLLFSASMVATVINIIHLHTGHYASIEVVSGTLPAFNPFPQSVTLWEELMAYIGEYDTYIVWLWLGAICIKSLHMALSLHRLRYIAHNHVYDAGTIWQQRVDALCAKMAISRPVSIMQSGLAKVPLALGYFKPLILVPLGLINQLSADEVEAIICHELAHIKRKDYLVNMLQSFMDVVFCFNPAVLWLNRLIRREREHCCDDMVLAANVGIHSYVNAMVTCSEFELGTSGYAMALGTSKGLLLQRVKRIIDRGNRRTTTAGKLLLLAMVVATAILAVACSQNDGAGRHMVTRRIETDEQQIEIQQIDDGNAETAAMDAQAKAADQYARQQDSIKEVNDAVLASTPQEPANPTALHVDTVKNEFTDEDGNNMSNELRTDGIISATTNTTTYMMDGQQLIVNNTRQPAAVHKKYFDKYLKYNGRSVCYNRTYKTN